MPLVKATLAAAVKAALDASAGADPVAADATRLALANSIADAVDTFVKTADVTVGPLNPGLQTTTAPGAPTGPPAVPVIITGGIS